MNTPHKALDRLQIVGFVVSVAISVGLIAVKQDTVQSVILGLALAILTQLFDLQMRNQASEERLTGTIELSKRLFSDAVLFDHVDHITNDYLSIKKGSFGLFKRRADDMLVECRKVLRSMSGGTLRIEQGSPYTFGTTAVEQATQSLKAAATANMGFWRSSYGDHYLTVNSAAVERGVQLTRVFVQSITTLRQMLDILQEQQNLGINVYVAPREDLPPKLIEDYMIVDNHILIKLELTHVEQKTLQAISIDPLEVEAMLSNFDLLLRHSISLSQFAERYAEHAELNS